MTAVPDRRTEDDRGTPRRHYVTSAHDGWPLEEFLAAHVPDVPPRVLRRLLVGGSVLVDGGAGWLGRKLRSGERVTLELPGDSRAAPEPAYGVLLEDASFLVVDKPAGTPVVPDRSREVPSLIERIREQRDSEALVVHRIDKDASGAVVVALDRASHRSLSLQFQRREVAKEYLALVTGEPDRDEGRIELPIGHDPRHKMRMRTDRNAGKPSTTRYRVVERFRDYALLRVFPETGRTHQIRVHLAGVGHALAVDPTYGGRAELWLSELKPDYRVKGRRVERPILSRLTLHASRVRLRHPSTGEEVTAAAPLPEDLALVLKMLRKYRPPRSGER